MSLFITAVPLFNAEMAVEAYRLKHQSGERLLGLKDDYKALSGVTDAPGIERVNQVGLEPFTGGKPLFIDVNKFQLLGNVPQTVNESPENIFFVVSSDAIDDEDCFGRCLMLKTMGFGLGVENYDRAKDEKRAREYLSLCDYALLDTTRPEFHPAMIKALSNNRAQHFILTDILSNDAYRQLKAVRNALYEGRFYSQPITMGSSQISALKLNALQLLRLIGDDDFDLTIASDIIRNDPAISISLLRFINSPGIGVTQRITSISNAVALLGQKETKKWISAAVSVKLSEDKPNEITKLSLVRAKFAENLAPAFSMAIQSPSLFMLGLFSLLDVILERPMKEAMEEVAVDKKIYEALVDQEGSYYDVLSLIYSYERAEWETVSLVMIRHDLNAADIEKAFMDALLWYRDLLEMQQSLATELE